LYKTRGVQPEHRAATHEDVELVPGHLEVSIAVRSIRSRQLEVLGLTA
jgi:hypothetical protein